MIFHKHRPDTRLLPLFHRRVQLIEEFTQATNCLGDLRLFGFGCARQRPFQGPPGQLRKPVGKESFDRSRRMDARNTAIGCIGSPLEQTFNARVTKRTPGMRRHSRPASAVPPRTAVERCKAERNKASACLSLPVRDSYGRN